MAKRSPILGYNHNIRHRGLVFHVQTEDSGVDNPHIFTHVFHGGVILNSRKLVYDAGADEDVVKSLMQAQHKALLRDLKGGRLSDKIESYLGGNPELLPFDSGHDPVERPETEPFHLVDAAALEQRPSRTLDAAAVAPTVELAQPPGEVSAAFEAVKAPESIPPVAPVVSFKGDPAVAGADSTYSQRRQAPPRQATRHAPPPPPIPTGRAPAVPERRPASKSGGVVVSRPAVIVGAPSRVVGSSPSSPGGAKPRARTTRARTASEKSPESLFGQGLISEKSLDEVILAYLSDDSAED
ncbi:MAG TPA: hypothetical protein VML75_07915 [Kofleriaceae bacterium]|nr:hypothetical protein [Kofleriaceae bacterium]